MRCLGLLCVATTLAFGCGTDDDAHRPDADRVADACGDYCSRRLSCGDQIDVDACATLCESVVDGCGDDEAFDALDDLDQCTEGRCDDIGGCGIEQGDECGLQL